MDPPPRTELDADFRYEISSAADVKLPTGPCRLLIPNFQTLSIASSASNLSTNCEVGFGSLGTVSVHRSTLKPAWSEHSTDGASPESILTQKAVSQSGQHGPPRRACTSLL